MAKIKRSEVMTFMNVLPSGSATYKLIGDGVTTGAIEYNPKTTEETYIHEDSATISVESYAPSLPVEAIAVSGDDVFEFIDALRVARAVNPGRNGPIRPSWLRVPSGKINTISPRFRRLSASLMPAKPTPSRSMGMAPTEPISHPNGANRNNVSRAR